MRSLLSAAFLLIAGACFAQYPGATAPPQPLKKGFDTISVRDAKRVLTYLATKCEGRGTGQPGFEKAAEFIAKQFKDLGLKPLGDDGTYFQKTDFTRWRFDPTSVHLKFDGKTPGLGGADIVLQSGNPDLDVKGSLTQVTDTELPNKQANQPDFQADQFKGQIVYFSSTNTYSKRRFESAFLASGALAVLTSDPKVVEGSWHPRMGKTPPSFRSGVTGVLTSKGLKKFMEDFQTMKNQQVVTPNGYRIEMTSLGAELTGKIATETVKVGNVVAELPGSDPTLANQYVGIGGHLDHLGIQDGVVYPGADDDGSGSTAVVEIARAMTASPVKPKRSIVFMTFFGEEMGLLGSRFLTDHPPVPLKDMVAELQMDMVGRDSDGVQNGDQSRVDVAAQNVDTIRLVGSKRISTELDKTIQEENQYIGFKFKYDAEDVYTRSDHYNFASKGIPIAFLFDGFHPDYHRPTDTIEKIDWLKLTNAAKLYYLTGLEIANRDAPPKKDVATGSSEG